MQLFTPNSLFVHGSAYRYTTPDTPNYETSRAYGVLDVVETSKMQALYGYKFMNS
jgi:hypothetical protein